MAPTVEAENADTLLTLVNDSARALGTRYVRFIGVAAYVAITVAGTPDEKLLLGAVVNLPLLNTSVPMSGACGFGVIAPVLIFLLHFDLVLQWDSLHKKLSRFQRVVAQLPADERYAPTAGLILLACTDAYIARAYAWHALSNEMYPDRGPLARALLAATNGSSRCRGVEQLADNVKDQLQQVASTLSASQSASAATRM